MTRRSGSFPGIAVVVGLVIVLLAPSLGHAGAVTVSAAESGLCALDPAPAATLLVPRFAVDLDDRERMNTVVTIANASSEIVVVNATIWSRFGIPTVFFNLYLTGWDVVTWDLADAFLDGNLPVTGNTVSPHGPWSQPADGNDPPQCDLILPFDNPVIPVLLLDRLQRGLTGEETVYDGACLAPKQLDRVATGAITFDVVGECNLLDPSQVGFWDDVARADSVLVGSYRLVDRALQRVVDLPAVHLEAAPDGFFLPGDRTWGGHWLDGEPLDRREPLPSRWAVRFDADTNAELHVWRSAEADSISPVPCGTAPPGMPLPTEPTLVFDDAENPLEIALPLPYEVSWLNLDLVLPIETSGWAVFDLRHDAGIAAVGDRAQAHVRTVPRNDGFSQLEAAPLDSNCPPLDLVAPGASLLFADGFETGGCLRWSSCPSP